MSELTVGKLIEMLPSAYQPANEDSLNPTCVSIQIIAKGEDGGEWHIHIEDNECSVLEGLIENPDLKLTAKAQDILDIVTGKMDAMKAFMLGKVRFAGSLNLAIKISHLFSIPEELSAQWQ